MKRKGADDRFTRKEQKRPMATEEEGAGAQGGVLRVQGRLGPGLSSNSALSAAPVVAVCSILLPASIETTQSPNRQ